MCNEKNKLCRLQPLDKKEEIIFFFSFSPQRQYEDIFGCSLKAIFLEENFLTSRFHWRG